MLRLHELNGTLRWLEGLASRPFPHCSSPIKECPTRGSRPSCCCQLTLAEKPDKGKTQVKKLIAVAALALVLLAGGAADASSRTVWLGGHVLAPPASAGPSVSVPVL